MKYNAFIDSDLGSVSTALMNSVKLQILKFQIDYILSHSKISNLVNLNFFSSRDS